MSTGRASRRRPAFQPGRPSAMTADFSRHATALPHAVRIERREGHGIPEHRRAPAAFERSRFPRAATGRGNRDSRIRRAAADGTPEAKPGRDTVHSYSMRGAPGIEKGARSLERPRLAAAYLASVLRLVDDLVRLARLWRRRERLAAHNRALRPLSSSRTDDLSLAGVRNLATRLVRFCHCFHIQQESAAARLRRR